MPVHIRTALPVDYGIPSNLEAILLLVLVALCILKLTTILWKRGKKIGAALFCLTGIAILLFYFRFASDAHGLFLSAQHGLLTVIQSLTVLFYIVAVITALWMIVDWLRPR